MITIDGAENNDDAVGGPLQNVPQDAVQEFQIATNRYSAESGRSGASAINVVTRSGTDVFRGTASFFLRDDELAGTARDLRPPPGGSALRPPAVRAVDGRADPQKGSPIGSLPSSTATRTGRCW